MIGLTRRGLVHHEIATARLYRPLPLLDCAEQFNDLIAELAVVEVDTALMQPVRNLFLNCATLFRFSVQRLFVRLSHISSIVEPSMFPSGLVPPPHSSIHGKPGDDVRLPPIARASQTL
jgi:hypothetical protein